MRVHGPWIIEDSQKKFQNAFVEVTEDRVTQPDGSHGTCATVSLKAGVAVLPIDDDGMVYLTRQFRYAFGRQSVEVVSGAIEAGETAPQAAERELREEVGLLASEWTELGTIDIDTSILRCPVQLFVAKGLRRTEDDPDPSERIERLKKPLDAAVRMVQESEITHSPSCVLILKQAAEAWLRLPMRAAHQTRA